MPRMNTELLEETVWAGRLAFERVCRRAKTCPNGSCRRRKVCLARGGVVGLEWRKANWFQPTGGCPVMTESEWRKVQDGIRANTTLLQPIRAAQREAQWAALPRDEQKRRTEAAREEAPTPRDPMNYGQRLWLSYHPERGAFCTPGRFGPERGERAAYAGPKSA